MAREEPSLGSLLIVGPGVLGSYLAKRWVEQGGEVVGRTATTKNHPRLKDMGIITETQDAHEDRRYPNVVFCAPPSGSDNYPDSVQAAVQCWEGTGSCVFTSSTGVHPPTGSITEQTPTMPLGTSERLDRLIRSEEAVLKVGGNVVRLGGLYHATRGAHSAFISRGACSRSIDHRYYLLHYQDAAELVLQVLLRGSDFRGEIFLGTELQSVSAKEVVDAALASGLFEGEVKFEGTASGKGPDRLIDCSKTREKLKDAWVPQYEYSSFMRLGGQDWYRDQ